MAQLIQQQQQQQQQQHQQQQQQHHHMPLKLTDLPIEILYLIIFSVDNAKDLRHLSSVNRLFKALSGPHTITAHLWFKRYSRDIPEEDLLKVANEWKFPLETEYAKSLITINAPPEPPGLSADPPGPKRALRRQKRVLHIVERFSLFLHNMLAVNYYYSHDWDKLQKVADDVEQYLEDLGWVQFYRGQMDRGIDSIMVSTVQADQEFEAIAFEDFTRKLRTDIAAVSTMKTSSSSNNSNNFDDDDNDDDDDDDDGGDDIIDNNDDNDGTNSARNDSIDVIDNNDNNSAISSSSISITTSSSSSSSSSSSVNNTIDTADTFIHKITENKIKYNITDNNITDVTTTTDNEITYHEITSNNIIDITDNNITDTSTTTTTNNITDNNSSSGGDNNNNGNSSSSSSSISSRSISSSSISSSSSATSVNSNDIINSNRSSEIFASPEPVYLRWTSLIQDQLNFFCLQQYIMDKFKPPSKWQLAEYLSVVLFGNI